MATESRRSFLSSLAAGAGLGSLPAQSQTAARTSRYRTSTIHHLPLRDFGFQSIPAIPYLLNRHEPLGTLLRLRERSERIKPAIEGLSNTYEIGGYTASGKDFLFAASSDGYLDGALKELVKILARSSDDLELLKDLLKVIFQSGILERDNFAAYATSLNQLTLDKPSDFSIGWTNFSDVFQNAQPTLAGWASSLESFTAADEQFWPTIAQFSAAYNLIVLESVTSERAANLRTVFGDAWTVDLDTAVQHGLLYAIDLSLFRNVNPVQVDGFERFTPATITLLAQDPNTKRLTPALVYVASSTQEYVYSRRQTPGTWLYALQAAKVSLTVYGIWLGHVYQWHISSAALQMTMMNTLSADHPVAQLVAPQSNYLIGFNEVLLLLWEFIAPPTSIASSLGFLKLIDGFAEGRSFFDDDPTSTIAALHLNASAFTDKKPWDAYPIVGDLLTIWGQTQAFVEEFVDNTYCNDAAIASDIPLQKWIAASGDPEEGNIRGLPKMDSRANLISFLTSFLYRLTAHGISRLNQSANPALTFVANFPPCLQISQLPLPGTQLSTSDLMSYLPRTGTIGKMIHFYFTFVFSSPYVPFIPAGGVQTDLFFPSGLEDPRNVALVERRNALISFIRDYEPNAGTSQIEQWPMNIET